MPVISFLLYGCTIAKTLSSINHNETHILAGQFFELEFQSYFHLPRIFQCFQLLKVCKRTTVGITNGSRSESWQSSGNFYWVNYLVGNTENKGHFYRWGSWFEYQWFLCGIIQKRPSRGHFIHSHRSSKVGNLKGIHLIVVVKEII